MKKCIYIIIFCFSLPAFPQYAWNPVGSGANLDVQALEADTNANLLYLGGIFTQTGGLPSIGIAKWDGVTYSPVGNGLLTGVGVSSLLMRNGNLVAGGTFTNIGGVLSNNIAEWNGSSWSPLGSGLNLTVGVAIVKALAVYNNELYAGGTFDNSAATPLSFIAKWDGVNWVPVGTGTNGTVSSLCVYNNELYVGGTFTSAGGVAVNNIAKWDGFNWFDVGGGCSYTGAISVSALQVYSGDLYAGGSFTTAGTTPVNHIARWNGVGWSDPGGGANYTGAISVSAFEIFHGELIAGGTFDSLGSGIANYVGKWNGTTWSPMGLGMNAGVNTLKTLKDTLYAGGLFTMADGTLSLFVSQWDSSQSTLTVGTNTEQQLFSIYPNPVQNKIFIRVKAPFAKAGTLQFTLYDAPGRELLKKEVEQEIGIDREQIGPGIYFYKISDPDKKVLAQGKIIFTN